jgi:hypothetical protein
MIEYADPAHAHQFRPLNQHVETCPCGEARAKSDAQLELFQALEALHTSAHEGPLLVWLRDLENERKLMDGEPVRIGKEQAKCR